MKEVLITSSVLIAALLILRRLFRNTLSRRVQYALWGLVLIRLLIPVSLPAMEHNVLTAAEPVEQRVTARLDRREIYVRPMEQAPVSQFPQAETLQPGDPVSVPESDGYSVVSRDGATVTRYAEKLSLSQVLHGVWIAGIAGMSIWFALTNLRFYLRLRRARKPYPAADCALPVYLVEQGLPSPCLFGLLRPAIYLTPATLSSAETLRHVLAHESTHARHLDPLWSLLRGVALSIYWFDPLVWAAAIVSRQDCELACDEGALRLLGPDQRIAYGRTLLSMVPVRRGSGDPMLAATTMSAGKKQLKDRISRIAENRKVTVTALAAVAVLAALICAVTFSGSKQSGSADTLSEAELSYFNESYFNSERDPDLSTQFLTSLYKTPEEIDLLQLFYNGAGQSDPVGEAERAAVVNAGYSGFDPEVDLTKLPADQIDDVLERYTGLTLDQTKKVSLDSFTYLPEYDAYYFFHSDTNTPGTTLFSAGERKGDQVLLYYNAKGRFFTTGTETTSADGRWACVTLNEQADGSYLIESHQLCSRPDALLNETRPLNGAELTYFNTVFFNNDLTENGTVTLNIHNQFLTSLYEKPEEINLYDLLYCGTGTQEPLSEEELQQVGNLDTDGVPICPTDKMSISSINALLMENLGLTLDETQQLDMDHFTYLPEYRAYYHSHGDTNYRTDLQFFGGERSGNQIRLYYKDFYFGGNSTACVTLEQQTNGSYHFLSHLLSDVTSTPTVYPANDPWKTIPLSGLTPLDPEPAALTHHSGDCAERGGGWSIDSDSGAESFSIRPYRATDGNIYVAVITDEAAGPDGMLTWEADCFLQIPEYDGWAVSTSDVQIWFFSDLLGHSGFSVCYRDYTSGSPETGGSIDRICNYYYLDDSGTPYLLAHTIRDASSMDLDGDGKSELVSSSGQIFFERDGKPYQVNALELLRSAWPQMGYTETYGGTDASSWDPYYRCLHFWSFLEDSSEEHSDQAGLLSAFRTLYFDGENLLFYKEDNSYTDHVADGIYAPADVLAATRARVLDALADYQKQPMAWNEDLTAIDQTAQWDDWRITGLSKAELPAQYEALGLRLYSFGYELHTPIPERVCQAGGMYIDEDGWAGGLGDSSYLVFVSKDGGWTLYEDGASLLDPYASPNSDAFKFGLWHLTLAATPALPSWLPVSDSLLSFYMNPYQFLNRIGTYDVQEQQSALDAMVTYAQGVSDEEEYLTDGLQKLRWNSHALDANGQAAYARLLDLTD